MNNIEYNKILKLLKKDENIFIGFVEIVSPTNAAQIKAVHKQSQSFTDEGKAKVQKNIEPMVVQQVDAVLNKKRKWGGHGKELPKLLKTYEGIITPAVKQKIVKKVCGPMKDFYPYAKKELLEVTLPWINTESEALGIIQHHHRSLDTKIIDTLLTKISNGIDHPDLKKFRESSLPFVARSLNALDMTNPDDRRQVVNSIAKTPSLMRLIDHNITLTLDDLKSLPPARRLDFMEFLYEPVLGRRSHRGTYYGTITKQRIQRARKKYGADTRMPIAKIPRDDMKHLLFAVSLRKNEIVATWWERYEKYLDKQS